MVEVKIVDINYENNAGTPVVVLETLDGEPKQKLTIWVGEPEFFALKIGLEENPFLIV